MAWTLPAAGRITSPYGPRVLAGAIGTFHYGVDVGAKRGPVYAAQDGVVRTIWQTAVGAWVVDVRHPDEAGHQIRTRYVHMYRSEILVTVGQHVTAGQQIGRSGASGTGAAHLHLEVMVDGQLVDPVPFLAARGVHLGVVPVVDVVATTPPVPVPVVTPAPLAPLTALEEDDMKDVVIALYIYVLRRMPDPTGLAAALVDLHLGHKTLPQIELDLRASDEYRNMTAEERDKRSAALGAIW